LIELCDKVNIASYMDDRGISLQDQFFSNFNIVAFNENTSLFENLKQVMKLKWKIVDVVA